MMVRRVCHARRRVLAARTIRPAAPAVVPSVLAASATIAKSRIAEARKMFLGRVSGVGTGLRAD